MDLYTKFNVHGPPSIAFVSYKLKYVHEVLINHLVKLAQEKVLLGELTIAFDRDVKNQINPTNNPLLAKLWPSTENSLTFRKLLGNNSLLLLDFSLTVKAAPHACVIRTGQP